MGKSLMSEVVVVVVVVVLVVTVLVVVVVIVVVVVAVFVAEVVFPWSVFSMCVMGVSLWDCRSCRSAEN
jgi:hypothetical protein